MVLVNVKGVDIVGICGYAWFWKSQNICRLSPRTRQWIGWFWMGGVMKNFGAEYGLLVSWSGFKSSIINETAKQFFEIRLLDA